MSNFWACVADEFQALGAWCMIHGPEVWIAITLWAFGAFCGICVMWLAWGFDKERKK